MSGIQAKKIAGYVIMPGILPRLNNLLSTGFEYIAFLIAQIYAMVRLLPPNHPYLNPQNIGQYSIRTVVAQAANHLELKKENIDQLLIFFTILVGLVLLILQFITILFAIIFEPAMAAFPAAPYPTGPLIFITPDPTLDIAYMLLDQVFGIPELFNSCIALNTPCTNAITTVAPTPVGAFPWPFHEALHQLFRFYNTGILVIGALIFLYFVVIVVGETAVTGTPFGQRFQNVWVPIRLVAAIGLLVPLNYGLNSGQYITLFAAKFGSSLATNGWITYNNSIQARVGAGSNPTGEVESLIGNPKTPDVTPILEAMSIIHTCSMGEWFKWAPTEDQPAKNEAVPPNQNFPSVQAYLFKEPADWMPNQDVVRPIAGLADITYEDALEFYNFGDITINFGSVVDAEDKDENADVREPRCGQIKISIHQVGGTEGSLVGPEAIQRYYFNLIRALWFLPADTYEQRAFAYRYAALNMHKVAPDPNETYNSCNPPNTTIDTNIPGRIPGDTPDECLDPPTTQWRAYHIAQLQARVETTLTSLWNNFANQTDLYEMNSEILQRGWAGAGIWYNTISRVNGNFMSAVRDIPIMSKYPSLMIQVKESQNEENETITSTNVFCPNDPKTNMEEDNKNIAAAMCQAYKYWNEANKNPNVDEEEISGSAFEDAMNLIFGTYPLSAMTDENARTHPLAQLALLGKGLVDASIRNIATASAASAIGGLGTIFDRVIPSLVTPSADFILSTAFVGLTGGLVLYYIVPFLPFIYFFFAVASWVKSIFEAMVGVPLWALAHLRLDGEGLPGTSAANGYFLILEIFLRPIFTVFGLVAATLIFTAQVRVLHFLWSIVTENLAGFNDDPTLNIAGEALSMKRSIIDEFFFSVIYAIIVYMMAIAAFKLIDKIPDNLLRWMGNSVSSFGDINQDSVDGLTRYAALGGATAGQNLAQGVQQLSGGTGGTVGRLLSRMTGGP